MPHRSDRNAIYQWPLLKSTEEKAEEELEIARQRAVSPTQEAQVNEVTHELIEWSKNLVHCNNTTFDSSLYQGDEEEYIDETTIKRIFASDYEAKVFILSENVFILVIIIIASSYSTNTHC